MATTYTKPTVIVRGETLMSYTFVGDANVYEAFKAHKTAEVKGEENIHLIPFHAVKMYTKEVTSENAERADAYCEGSGK